MGEAASDYPGNRRGTAVAMPVAGLALVAALVVQFRVRRYVASVGWLAVVMVRVFGTMLADRIHNGPAVPYVASTADWMAVPRSRGGLGRGTGVVTGVMMLPIIVFVT